MEAIDFLMANRLLVPGSVVYFDDWKRSGEGMRKAYDELTHKHRISWRVLTLFESYLPLPKLQQIVRIGGA